MLLAVANPSAEITQHERMTGSPLTMKWFPDFFNLERELVSSDGRRPGPVHAHIEETAPQQQQNSAQTIRLNQVDGVCHRSIKVGFQAAHCSRSIARVVSTLGMSHTKPST